MALIANASHSQDKEWAKSLWDRLIRYPRFNGKFNLDKEPTRILSSTCLMLIFI